MEMKPLSIAVHLHVFYASLIPFIKAALDNIPDAFDLYVSIPDIIDCDELDIKNNLLEVKHVKTITIERVPNRGRDIAPMLCTFKEKIMQHDVLFHLHTKKSPHDSTLAGWLPFICHHLLHEENTSTILRLLSEDVGMVCSPDFTHDPELDGWGRGNIDIAQQVIDRSSLNIDLKKDYPFIDYPQGSIFWARTDFLHPLFMIPFDYGDFPQEPIGVDGTLAHALERLFFIWGTESGKKIYKVYSSRDEYLLHQRFEELSVMNIIEAKKKEKHLRIIRMLIFLSSFLLLIILFLLALII
jgi:lipopolysaccharide biosynthesis protein